ncbi:MAG: beta-ketoacyl-[acyl-carrier-protein] synthase family protein [Acidimicrobiia bacterium]|jgi:3-oxoacyl-[acyl-carrier-protein] synthase II|nr:beta-ketoacyl-[acyl-carrier-protein] synthase family protein [Acidimicrobiia bacterium]MBP8182241.1 beta-ketoacyl-[acyl-carrier-protein] synthase family protein [Acidimicrobiia bacterium]
MGAEKYRVVVTGLAAVTNQGTSLDETWSALRRAEDGPVPHKATFDVGQHLDRKLARRLDRSAQLAVAVGLDAWRHADLGAQGPSFYSPHATSVLMSNAMPPLESLEQVHDNLAMVASGGKVELSRQVFPGRGMNNAGTTAVAMELGITGPVEIVSTACSGGSHAIVNAARWVASGLVDVVLTGGYDAALGPVTDYIMLQSKVAAAECARPFDSERDGFFLTEGAAALVLERRDKAIERGARIYGEILGGWNNCDAFSAFQPRPDGEIAERCVRTALSEARLTPGDVAWINAHGTGTRVNDHVECEMFDRVFGVGAVPVTSLKGVLGHSGGAAGAVEAAVTIRALNEGIIPRTTNCRLVDPAITSDIVLSERTSQGGPVLSTSFGLGGQNSALLIGPPA